MTHCIIANVQNPFLPMAYSRDSCSLLDPENAAAALDELAAADDVPELESDMEPADGDEQRCEPCGGGASPGTQTQHTP